jgi:hypothetical protein
MKLNEMRQFEQNLLEMLIENLKKGGENVASYIKNYIGIVNNFYKYSARNQFLILSQYPKAEYVNSVRGWNKKKRFVKKGEHGIKIYSPVIKEIEKEVEIDMTPAEIEDYAIAHPELSANQLPKTKKIVQKEKEIVAMMPRTVFDVKQTDGERFELEKPKRKNTADKYIAIKNLCKKYGINTEITDGLKVLPLENKINVFIGQLAERLLAKHSKLNEINKMDIEIAKLLTLASIDIKVEDDMEAVLTLWVTTAQNPVESLLSINKSVAEIVKGIYS